MEGVHGSVGDCWKGLGIGSTLKHLAGNNTYKIDPLNRDNYVAWCQQLEWILNDPDLWD